MAGTFLNRKGNPDKSASVIAFPASAQTSFTTGAEYLIDGDRILGRLNI